MIPDLIVTSVFCCVYCVVMGGVLAAMHTASAHARGVTILVISALTFSAYMAVLWTLNSPL